MAYTTELLDHGRGVLHVGSEIVTGKELLDGSMLVFQALRSGHPICYGLPDFTAITQFQVGTDDIKALAKINTEMAKIVRQPTCVAVVAPSDLAYGISRMWEVYVEPTLWKTRVFRSRPEANAWLAERIGSLPDWSNHSISTGTPY